MARLERGGFALHYEVVGEGFPLVLLPGAASDGSAWHHAGFVSLLEHEFACVLFDPPGMGSSDVPSDLEEWGVGAIAEDVVALADQLRFDRFALWGASAGGAAATVVVAEHPGRVVALVLSGQWPADQEQWREYFESTAADVRASGGMATLARLYEEEGLALPDWAEELAPDGEMIARILEGLLAYDWAGRALPERITVPTLILVGEQEDPGREAEAAAAAMPDGQAVYLAGLGHVGAWPEAPEESVARALPFLRRALTRPAS